MTRCQICGRRQAIRRSGGIRRHYVRSNPCPGEGFPPIEEDDSRLVAVLREAQDHHRRLSSELLTLLDRRANWIDPALYRAIAAALADEARLQRRLKRHRSWPDRYNREMERQGWGSPPPPYLLARSGGAAGATGAKAYAQNIEPRWTGAGQTAGDHA